MITEERIVSGIRLGVTGHRTLSNTAVLQAAIREAVAMILAALPEAKAIASPLTIVSPLAEGADRLVARTILEDPQAQLEAVLPLAIEDYLEDFATQASRDEFQMLLGRAVRVILLRQKLLRCGHVESELSDLRLDAYLAAGNYVVDHCDVLLAVWDGAPARGRGGTAEVVKYARDMQRPVLRIWGATVKLLRGN
jgi:hypothetical protein